MQSLKKTTNNEKFIPWLLANFRQVQQKVWLQVGWWSVMITILIFMTPKIS